MLLIFKLLKGKTKKKSKNFYIFFLMRRVAPNCAENAPKCVQLKKIFFEVKI